jgi:hypothetical protein
MENRHLEVKGGVKFFKVKVYGLHILTFLAHFSNRCTLIESYELFIHVNIALKVYGGVTQPWSGNSATSDFFVSSYRTFTKLPTLVSES